MTDPEIVAGLKAVVFDRPKIRLWPDPMFELQVWPAELAAMEAAIARLSATCWQPIEQAIPWSRALVYDPAMGCVLIAYLRDMQWELKDGALTVLLNPTHWMPLPHTPHTEEP